MNTGSDKSMGIFGQLIQAIVESEKNYRISFQVKIAIMIAPFVIVILQGLLLLRPETRRVSEWLLREDHPVEFLTFFFLFAGGLLCLSIAVKTWAREEDRKVSFFYAVVSAGMVLVAMEEIAWGQRILGFSTPDAFLAINLQGETTLHNIRGLQGNSEYMRLGAAIGGFVGILLSVKPEFRKIGVPVILFPWILIIFSHASLDTIKDLAEIFEERPSVPGAQAQARTALSLGAKTSELIEMMIAILGFLYALLNNRSIDNDHRLSRQLDTEGVPENRTAE